MTAACSPTLDWRQVKPEGSQATLMFPCRPSGHERRVTVANVEVAMSMFACTAGDATYALAFADVADPARVTAALEDLGRSAVANIQAASASAPLIVPGMTPNALAAHWRLSGRLPDKREVHEQLALFAHGTRVYQATVIGARLDAEAMQTFFSALRVGE